MYVMKNKMKENVSFKYYIYMIAKSRAINYIKIETRRTEIIEQYLHDFTENIEKDVLELITKEETKKEIIEAIELLDDKYKNAIYLAKIEELSYEEISKILGQTLQNTKNLIHRGKKELRKILLKKGFDNMNKILKIFVITISITALLSGIVYATTVIYNNIKNNTNKVNINPTYQSTLDPRTINNLWVGTLDLAWKDLKEKIGLNKIEVEGENPQIVNDLNDSIFTKKMLDQKDYKINVERTLTNGYKIDATLSKNLNFLQSFDNFSNDYTKWTFGNGKDYIKYFGINNASSKKMRENVEILFYNEIGEGNLSSNDMAIKLNTKEGDEIILYRTNDKKTFNEYYEDIKNKANKYTGTRNFSADDELRIPYIKINGRVSYKELFGKEIKNSNGLYIYDVIQNIKFSLNEKGCNLSSSATMVTEYKAEKEKAKYCYFTDTFVIFMKEKDCDKPYFALKVDNNDILEKIAN